MQVELREIAVCGDHRILGAHGLERLDQQVRRHGRIIGIDEPDIGGTHPPRARFEAAAGRKRNGRGQCIRRVRDEAQGHIKCMAYIEFFIEIIRRSDAQKGFEVLSRRRVVERTFGWMTHWRRLVRGYEAGIDVSQAVIRSLSAPISYAKSTILEFPNGRLAIQRSAMLDRP